MKEIIKIASICVAFVLVIGVIAFGLINSGNNSPEDITGNTVKEDNGEEYQEVRLTFRNYEYQLEPRTLREGIPVRMTADLDSLYGCMRDVVIPEFNVRQYVTKENNIIEFTPDKIGTFKIMCSMNMGRGTFSVR